jgi:hypothetical protein
MTTALANSIILQGPNGQRDEFIAASGSAIKPGMLVKRTTAGPYSECNVHATSGGTGCTLIVLEDDYQGDTVQSAAGVTRTYTVGDRIFAEYALPGAKRHLLLKASENVAIGDLLISDGTGLFIKTTGTPLKYFAVVEEASNVASNQLIQCRIL